jgi:PAS domain-containing protein
MSPSDGRIPPNRARNPEPEPGAIESARQTAQDQFRGVLDSMLDLVTIERIVRDDEGTIVDFVIEYMNPVNIDVAGRSRDELIGRSVLEVYPGRVRPGPPDGPGRPCAG